MTTSAIVALIVAGIIGAVSFLLKFMLTSITDGLKETIKELTSELKILGSKVDILSEKYVAASVTAANSVDEIDRIRVRIHDLSNIVMPMQGLLSRCKYCKD